MTDASSIVPSAPFIPEPAPTIIYRQVIEWRDRADLAEHAFDGQWRELTAYPDFGVHLMERWLPAQGDLVEMQHAVCPLGETPQETPRTAVEAFPEDHFATAAQKFVSYVSTMRAQGQPVGLWDLLFETLCKAMPRGIKVTR